MMRAKRIQIVYTINHIRKSGPNEVVKNMVRNIDREKYGITVISFLKDSDKQEVEQLVDLGASFVCLELDRKLDIITKGAKALSNALRGVQPDIIHSHGILSDIASYKSHYMCRYVSTVHNNIFEDYSYTFGRLRGWLFAYWHLYFLKKFDKVVCCSETAYYAIKAYPLHGTYIRNGIDYTTAQKSLTARASVRKDLGIRADDLVYIYTGKLSERKNVLSLLDSFKTNHTDNEHLIVMGDGELQTECERYASENIHVIGFSPNVASYLDMSDIYVSASKSEGFSISIIEALSKGLSVLLSDIPSHKELFTIDQETYIGEVFNSENFQTKKKELTSHARDRMLISRFKDKYLSGHSMMRNYESIYDEVVK